MRSRAGTQGGLEPTAMTQMHGVADVGALFFGLMHTQC